MDHNNLTVKSSYMQYCATYFMNLLILLTITKEDAKTIIRSKDWIYISQFWKMNIQEDVLLKFTSLFSISREYEGVCIKKKQVLDKEGQKNIIEKQKDIFNFLQDEISYGLYTLHDVGVEHAVKQEYRRRLIDKGVNIRFEELLGQINEYLLGNNPRFSLENNIRNVLQIISHSQVDASDVLDWTICVNNFLDRELYPVLYHRGVVSELMEVVMRKYPMYISIITEILKFSRKIGNVKVTRSNSFIRLLEEMAYDKPVLFLEYLDLFESYLSIEQRDRVFELLRHMLYKIDSLDLVAKILEKIYLFNTEMIKEDLLKDKVYNLNSRVHYI